MAMGFGSFGPCGPFWMLFIAWGMGSRSMFVAIYWHWIWFNQRPSGRKGTMAQILRATTLRTRTTAHRTTLQVVGWTSSCCGQKSARKFAALLYASGIVKEQKTPKTLLMSHYGRRTLDLQWDNVSCIEKNCNITSGIVPNLTVRQRPPHKLQSAACPELIQGGGLLCCKVHL